ncbi:MAG: thioredoxin domain-containing protein [Chloroflexi bacterium]|nr:thioredoxin domain-containing protein [Chloroflexota bacterium]
MAKKVSKKRRVQPQKRQTNWVLIGGVIAVGVIGLFALLFLSLQEPTATAETAETAPDTNNLLLENYCKNNPGNCVAKGSEDAAVTIIEVSDFGCPHCRNYNTQIAPLIDQQYVETGQVRYVVVPFALRSDTAPAANASLCAAEQDRYFEFSAAMFAGFDEPDARERSGFLRSGAAAGLDAGSFTECMDQARYNNILRDNIATVSAAGVSSTPNFFINGQKVEGAQPFAAFQQQIDALLGS